MMNRNEAVQKLSKVARISVAYAEDLYDSFFPKPVVPQFVADWLEKNDWRKDTSGSQTIFDVFDNLTLDASNGYYTDVKRWVEENGNILAQAWVNGYKVEGEPRYTVRIKGIGGYSKYLNRDTKTQKWLFASKTELERFRAHHTRKELESNGFGWVFDCEGIEIEEVTDGND